MRASRFDDAQLTAPSKLCEPSSSAAANTVDGDARSAQGRWRPADAGTARAPGSVSSRLSTVFRPHRVQAGHTATPSPPPSPLPRAACRLFQRHAAVVDNLKSQGRSRLASMPVRPQFNGTELAAAGKQANLETEPAAAQGARSQERCRVGLHSLASRAQEIFGALKFESLLV